MTELAPEKPEGKKSGPFQKKLGPLPVWAWAVGAGGLAAVGFWWWKNRSKAPVTGDTGSTDTGQQPGVMNNCYDYNGNLVPCAGYANAPYGDGTWSTSGTGGPGTGTGGTGTGTGDGSGDGTTPGGDTGGTGGTTGQTGNVTVPDVRGLSNVVADARLVALGLVPGAHANQSGTVNGQTPGPGAQVPVGTTVDLSIAAPSSGGGGTTPPPPTGGGTKVPAMPSGVTVSGVNRGGFKATWPAVSGATSYVYRITYQGKLVLTRTFTANSASVSGLTPDHTYTFHVKACNSAGCSSETNGPVVKTPK